MEEKSFEVRRCKCNQNQHAVLEEVARLAFAGELEERKDDIPFKLIPDRHRSSAAVFTKKERSSAREYVLRKVKRRGQRMTVILFRSSARHARTARSQVIQ